MNKSYNLLLFIKACVAFGILAMVPLSVMASANLTSFKPGKDWYDVDGKLIDCHAGNIIYQANKKTYYWFGEHRNGLSGVSCYSSKDLYNWKYVGLALDKAKEGLGSGIIERPKVAYNAKTNKYAMWFHYDDGQYKLAQQGVASCDSIQGPYKLHDHFQPNGHQSRDIGMFSDDDGKTYIGYAANVGSSINATVRIVELTDDYLGVTQNDVDAKANCEGPAMLKWKDNTYYLVTSLCNGWKPTTANYYTSSKMLSAFTKEGNPFVNDTKKTSFDSQPCSIFKVPGYKDAFIYLGDRWIGQGDAKSQYVFLPIAITSDGQFQLKWYDEWDLSRFTPTSTIDMSSYHFKKAVYENIINETGLHAFDLLGRNLPSYYKKIDNHVMITLDKSEGKKAIAHGIYIMP
jgi:beta-xylosidase